MPGWNLQTLKDEVLFLVQARHKAASARNVPDQQIFAYLRDAYAMIQRELKLSDRQAAASLVAGTQTYTAPSAMAGRNIEVWVRTAANAPMQRLEQRSYEWLTENFDLNDTSVAGTPEFFAWIPDGARSVIMRPVPDTSFALGILYITRLVPSQLWRIYNQSAITLTANAGSLAVTLSANPNATGTRNVFNGDEIGMVYAANTDGSASAGDSPRRWYKISSISGQSVTLDEAWEENNVSAQVFISAEVPQLEKDYPGQLRFAPSMLAAAQVLRGQGTLDASAALKAEALEILAAMDRDDAQLAQPTFVMGQNELPHFGAVGAYW